MKERERTNGSEADGRALAMAEATFPIYTQRVSLLSDSSMLDDSAPHVFTKSDIMLIQSEMLGDFSKYGEGGTNTYTDTLMHALNLCFLLFSASFVRFCC